MRVLWISNIVFPEAQTLLLGEGFLKSSGGWMLGSADALVTESNVKLIVASVSKDVKKLTRLDGEKITYYLLPYGKGNMKYNHDYEPLWIEVRDDVQPDVVHIHGTEFTHGLAYVKACGNKNVVVSVQGLVSVIANYFLCGLTTRDILRSITLRDVLRGTLFHDRNKFRRKGRCEVELLRSVNHVIGRTSWDKAHVWAINPKAQYHFCNETLRPEFYNGETWEYEKCVPHTIFLSQATYPIKGLHVVLKAMPLILKHFPDAQIRLAGRDITRSKEGIRGWIKLSGYGKIIKLLIRKHNLENCFCFLGNLDAKEMIKEYLCANVFICPSSIENSPNSLGEAQILGTPVIASYAGGIPDMMKGNEDNLYRYNDYEVLARKVCSVFYMQKNQIDMRGIALGRHDQKRNESILSEIYQKIQS